MGQAATAMRSSCKQAHSVAESAAGCALHASGKERAGRRAWLRKLGAVQSMRFKPRDFIKSPQAMAMMASGPSGA
jgi:hypothetical protein